MTLKELHEEYGKLMIQLEIIQNRTMELKRLIAEEMRKTPQPEEKKDEVKDR